jgi:signal transduction histidine kinase
MNAVVYERPHYSVVKELSDLLPFLCRPKEPNQVFMAIVVNALDALKGEDELRISTDHEEGRLTIEIVDAGPGIAAAELEKIFER